MNNYSTLTIKFYHSTSPRFGTILKGAQKYPSFKQCNKIYSVTFTYKQAHESYLLADNLKGIRNKRVLVDGHELPWKEVFCYMWCYALRLRAEDQLRYCMGGRADDYSHYFFNIWRCQQANMPLWETAEWLTYGHFDTDQTTFIFDKELIKKALLRNTHNFRFCPEFNIDTILRTLGVFPETVNPLINKDWKYFDTGIAPKKVNKICENILNKAH